VTSKSLQSRCYQLVVELEQAAADTVETVSPCTFSGLSYPFVIVSLHGCLQKPPYDKARNV